MVRIIILVIDDGVQISYPTEISLTSNGITIHESAKGNDGIISEVTDPPHFFCSAQNENLRLYLRTKVPDHRIRNSLSFP